VSLPGIRLPAAGDPRLANARAELDALLASDGRLQTFLRGYLRSNGDRVAAMLVLLRELLPARLPWLDVGSLGVEQALLAASHGSDRMAALACESNHVGVQAGALQERATPAPGFVPILAIDVERQDLPFADSSFNLVTCCEVLEHLKWTPLPLLREVRRVLAPEGILLLTTPNLAGSRSLLKLLAGQPPQEVPRYHRDAGHGVIHCKEYTAPELRVLLAATGFAASVTTAYCRRRHLAELALGAVLAVPRWLGNRVAGLPPWEPGDKLLAVAQRAPGAGTDTVPAALFE